VTAAAAHAPPRPPTALLDEVAAVSRRYGADPEFARAGGGNCSGKADGVLWIKPSGVPLASMSAEALMPVALAPLRAMLGDPGAAAIPGSDAVMRVAMAARLRPDDDRRPSVECLFHALLPDPIVLHTHPTTVNALTCAVRGRELATELLGGSALWIAYADPGLPLARRIAEERRAFEQATGDDPPRTVLLQNHGLIVSGESGAEIDARSGSVVDAVCRQLDGRPGRPDTDTGAVTERADIARLVGALEETLDRRVVFDGSPPAHQLATTAAGRAFVRAGPLTPDQIVYAGSWPLLLDPLPAGGPVERQDALRRALEDHRATAGAEPSIVVAAGLGVFGVGDTPGEAATARDLYLDAWHVGRGADRLGGARPMAPEERRFIEQWEAEAYRRGVAAAAGAADRPEKGR